MIELAGDRVLQVRVNGLDAFWTNPSATDWNLGGDRLWLGPERDWFYASGGLADHVVPASMNPGPSRGLVHRLTGDTTSASVTRTIEVLEDTPSRVVYETRTTVTVHSGRPVDAWSIVSVPLGGLLELPLSGPLHHRDYLTPIDPTRLEVSDDVLHLHLTGDVMTKLGFLPTSVRGRLSYTVNGLRIDRAFPVHPDAVYCDLPVGATGQGDAVQVFEDDGHYGGYAELEHHSPAATVGHPVTDVCRTTIRACG
ncbi:hypothetical protein ACFFQW_28750 [Umezawaea endophytica]|uniref:Uncharacterized protein n=1 Tax=Umezawaea endophytica TaxID=1654476 RepID=A0A9X3A724_9PSEU|nr:hypothetical protein [Umezawaea endophytica]MCS7483958.1 hypothetical protein [Umezawaea endophytica]